MTDRQTDRKTDRHTKSQIHKDETSRNDDVNEF